MRQEFSYEQAAYERAANLVMDYAKTHDVGYGTPPDKIKALLDLFSKQFGPDNALQFLHLEQGCKIIQSSVLDSVRAYEKLDDALNEHIGELASCPWVLKYFRMIFPDQFVGWYEPDELRHFLFGFGLRPASKYYGMNGQLALIRKKTGNKAYLFEDIARAMFGNSSEMRHFFKLDYSGLSEQFIEDCCKKGIVATGWNGTGSLDNYKNTKGSLGWKKTLNSLSAQTVKMTQKTATQEADGLKAFYDTSFSSVFVVTDGPRLVAFVDNIHTYFYDEKAQLAHQKHGDWHLLFDESDRLPADEGSNTACCELKNPENMLFLYQKYYQLPAATAEYSEPSEADDTMQATGYHSDLERNRIFFGAPGTGKSFTLNKEKDELPGVEYERVTFHPDYSYANFVGTYKPVPCKDSEGKDSISYSYVPGPFMRTYVQALKNSRTDTPKPFLLIIEEINRANVAAVFGDVFQLLDRDDDGRSLYPVQASEDIKKYLADKLGGTPDDYQEICIPGNMFIWATMNSADQGVFPMDTAFKRRWDFTYLGIDDSEQGIAGKKVVLGQGEYARMVEWNALRKAINSELVTYRLNEDKLLGPYFLSGKVLPKGELFDPDAFARVFKNKVIMYLFEDAAKQKRSTLFGGCNEEARNQYSRICREFDTRGVFIFCDSISSQFADAVPEADAMTEGDEDEGGEA
ncbi:MAG: AAA family ATPase [Desulfovibrionaceae bacterium]|nr:AAA family ATPase [Desulfovibrionaceae bacterium]